MAYRVKLLYPAIHFLEGLSDRFRAKVVRTIELLKEFGPLLREPHSKKVSDLPGLFELRVSLGHDTCRLFYFWHESQFYIVTSGYMKKAMKLDKKELNRASSLMRQFVEKYGGRHEST